MSLQPTPVSGNAAMSDIESEIEIIRTQFPVTPLKAAVFDFDGTVSLIVEGWQKLLLDMFLEHLRPLPGGESVSSERLRGIIDFNTGKQTITQAISLAEEIKNLGGVPSDPQVYLDEYTRRLEEMTAPRIAALERGENKDAHLVPGVCECLEMLRSRGIIIALISGSPESIVKYCIDLFGLKECFEGGIFGTIEGRHDFTKAGHIDRFLKERGFEGKELVGFGDGYTETHDVHRIGGLAIGVALDEEKRCGVDLKRRERLIEAGADWIISDFRNLEQIEAGLFGNVAN